MRLHYFFLLSFCHQNPMDPTHINQMFISVITEMLHGGNNSRGKEIGYPEILNYLLFSYAFDPCFRQIFAHTVSFWKLACI